MSIALRLNPETPEAGGRKKKPALRRREQEFLPAALEILEKPPSPTLRVTALALCAFAVIAVAWGTFGEVDIVAVAPGKIIPSGKVKVIQPLEPGIIRAIHVQEGQLVVAGQPLIELDPTETGADRERLATDLMASQVTAARLQAALDWAAGGEGKFSPPPQAAPGLVATHRNMLASQIEEHRSRLAASDAELTKLKAELQSASADIERLEKIIPLIRERADSLSFLLDKELIARPQYLEQAERLVAHEQELIVERNRRKEVRAAITALAEERRLIATEFRSQALEELVEARERIEQVTQELTKAKRRHVRQRLVAPIDGSVQRLAVHTEGGVVTSAQELMVIVPEHEKLEIEAWVENKDIGFVSEGQVAEIKIETLPFTKYGLVDGRLEHVSSDAMPREGEEETAGSPVYLAKVSMDRTEVKAGERWVRLTPGMSVTVEIKTGTRKLIEYVLSPLLRYRHDAVRER